MLQRRRRESGQEYSLLVRAIGIVVLVGAVIAGGVVAYRWYQMSSRIRP